MNTRIMSLVAAAAAAITAGLTAVPPLVSAAAAACRPAIIRLPDLGHGGGATAFNGTTVVGLVFDASGRVHPAIWRGGKLTVPHRNGIGRGVALDVNARGDIVGTNSQFSQAWELCSGTVRFLRYPPGSSGPESIRARRINARGQIAGTATFSSGTADGLRWASASAAPAILRPRPGDAASSASGINDTGVVSGETDQAVPGQAGLFIPHAATWNRSRHIRVLSGAYGPGTPADLFEINNAGATVGESYRTDASGTPVSDDATEWSPSGVPTDLGFLPGTNASVAFGLSQSGYAAGLTQAVRYPDFVPLSPPHGFVWPGHGPLLTRPVPRHSYAHSESYYHQITDDGTVAGTAGPVGGPDRPFLWTCAFHQAYRPSMLSAAMTSPAMAANAAHPAGWQALRREVGRFSG
jgi:uncharacterized membrane protein